LPRLRALVHPVLHRKRSQRDRWLGAAKGTAEAAGSTPAADPDGGDRPAPDALVERAEAAPAGRGGVVARPASLTRNFRWPFRRDFRWPFPIRQARSGAIRHRFADRGGRVLPTSPRPIEVWS
jgi:hypothetical protein